MSAYTQGKLEVKESPFEVFNRGHGQLKNQLVIGYTLVAALYDDEINAPNARRLAAAWNACEGIPTEALEAHADLCTPTDERVKALETENAHARATLASSPPCSARRCRS